MHQFKSLFFKLIKKSMPKNKINICYRPGPLLVCHFYLTYQKFIRDSLSK
jgi:hypothetical protein